MAPTVEWMEEQRQWASDWLEAARAWSQRLLQGLAQPQDVMLVAGNELGRLVAKQIRRKNIPIDIASLGKIEDYAVAAGVAALPRPARRIFHLADPTEPQATRDFSVAIATDQPASETSTLVIYATPSFLSLWDRAEQDLEQFLVERLQVIIVIVQPRFRPLDFANHSYLLSLLLSCFPIRKFNTSLQVYIAPDSSPVPKNRITRWMGVVGNNGWRLHPGPRIFERLLGESPDRFSALVISVTRPKERTIIRSEYRTLGSTSAVIPTTIDAAKRPAGDAVLGDNFLLRLGARIQVRLRVNAFLTADNEFVVAVFRSDSLSALSLVKRRGRAGQRVFVDHRFEFKGNVMGKIDLQVHIGLAQPLGMAYVNGDPSGQDHSLPVPFLEIRELN
jgi:hypothetical protein